MSDTTQSGAIVGALSITTPDGTVLTDSTDLGLAWKWAEHEWGDEWATLTETEKSSNVGSALHELRRAYAQS